jgi:putative lipoprotein
MQAIAATDEFQPDHACLMRAFAVAVLTRCLVLRQWVKSTTRSPLANAGRCCWPLVASLVGCALTQPVADSAATYVYRCEGEAAAVVVTIDGDRGHLFSRQLSQPIRRQADGVTFTGADTSYLPDRSPDLAPAQTATITIGGESLRNCSNDPRAAVWEAAKLRGISYRALGQEPPWLLEIDRDNGFMLVTGYASNSYRFPYSDPVSDTQQRSSRFISQENGEQIVITLTAETCHDSMSGEAFSGRVEIDWRGQRLRGCGRALH